MGLVKPPELKKGSLICLVAPARGYNDQAAFLASIKIIERYGYKVLQGKYLDATRQYFAGDEGQRLKDLQWALDHPDAEAIFCYRGGFGTSKLLDQLDFTEFSKYPKWVLGYSDITALHTRLNSLGFQSIHSEMPLNFGKAPKDSLITLFKILDGEGYTFGFQPEINTFQQVEVKGQLIGGNLTVLAEQVGCKLFYPNQQDSTILFLEDCHEPIYRIDRAFTQVRRSGLLKHCKAIMLGEFTKISNPEKYPSSLIEIFQEAEIPLIGFFPSGHAKLNLALPLGREVSILQQDKQVVVKF
jgi:muramoyltetrapeptide carboxypeptidase